PFVLAGRKLPPGQAAVVKLMGQLHADVAPQELEETIKQEPALGLALLRLLNAKAQSVARPVESLGQILEVLDRTQLQHWLQILAYADPDAAEPASSPLLMLATARGKLLELLAQALPQPGAVPQVAFTVGVMSLLDALFDLPMEKVLDGLTVAEDVRAALLAREGTYGDMLRLAEVLEQVDGGEVDLVRLLRPLGLTPEQLGALQLQALEWSGTLAYLNQPGKAREQA
ncbi:MAG TPA: EAL domain-containing protein, partial [Noviherbaspirillum sp.]